MELHANMLCMTITPSSLSPTHRGVVQQRYGFSSYGERRVLNASYVQTSSSATSDVGYGGYFEDAGTKMYQVRNRFLHPGLGRWINRDPIGYGGGINLYGYVNGNPVNGVDYFGLKCVDEQLDFIKAESYEYFLMYERKCTDRCNTGIGVITLIGEFAVLGLGAMSLN